MENDKRAGVVINTSADRRLGYTTGFRQILRENPGTLGSALRLAQLAENTYSPEDIQYGRFVLGWNAQINNWQGISEGDKPIDPPLSLANIIWGRGALLKSGSHVIDAERGLEVTGLGKATRELGTLTRGINRLDISSYFKMRLQGEDYFVKKSYATTNPGFDEFASSVVVKEALAGVEGLSVVQAHLGYSDNRQSWFVSKWEELESTGFFPYDTFIGGVPNDYAERLENEDKVISLREGLTDRVEQLKEEIRTRGQAHGLTILDLNVNLFYNPQTDKFFYLDVSTQEAGKIKQDMIWSREKGFHFDIPR